MQNTQYDRSNLGRRIVPKLRVELFRRFPKVEGEVLRRKPKKVLGASKESCGCREP